MISIPGSFSNNMYLIFWNATDQSNNIHTNGENLQMKDYINVKAINTGNDDILIRGSEV